MSGLLYNFEVRPLRRGSFGYLVFDNDLKRVFAGCEGWAKLQPRAAGNALQVCLPFYVNLDWIRAVNLRRISKHQRSGRQLGQVRGLVEARIINRVPKN